MAKTVLICDDALFMRSMLSDILKGADFEVVGEAQTGSEAVAPAPTSGSTRRR